MTASSIALGQLGQIDTLPREHLERSGAADLYVLGHVGTAAGIPAAVIYAASNESSWAAGRGPVFTRSSMNR